MLDMICTNCQSQYGQTVNVRDGGKAEWQCRDCKAVQPWVDEPEDASQYCGCVRCLQAFPDGAFPPRESRWLVVCVKCGNKRCPHAEWHGYECTGSNEPNQTPVRTGGLRPAKLADLAKRSVCSICAGSRIVPGVGEYTTETCPACKDSKRPAWIEAAAEECCKHLPAPWGAPCERSIFADVIEKHWRRAQ